MDRGDDRSRQARQPPPARGAGGGDRTRPRGERHRVRPAQRGSARRSEACPAPRRGCDDPRPRRVHGRRLQPRPSGAAARSRPRCRVRSDRHRLPLCHGRRIRAVAEMGPADPFRPPPRRAGERRAHAMVGHRGPQRESGSHPRRGGRRVDRPPPCAQCRGGLPR
ncbi:Uncharacterised protein [Mycobacteroides abscessus subsp. abscessus]|nr:Uncharacterised protein [Mycobacteroides abscessus subsp. abscessus]